MAGPGRWFFLILMMFNMPAMAQEAPGREAADRLDTEHEKAEAQASALRKSTDRVRIEIADLQQQLIALAAKRSTYQETLSDTEDKLRTLSFEETAILKKLDAERAGLMDLLAALERAGMNHPPALAVSPDDITAAARAALLLSGAAPELKARGDALATTLTTLNQVRASIIVEKERLLLQGQTLQTSTATLENLLTQRQALEKTLRRNANTAARQAQVFASRASTLRELIDQLELAASHNSPRHKPSKELIPDPSDQASPRQKPDPDAVMPFDPFIAPSGRFADSRGLLRLPVQGTIAYAFGQAKDKPRRSGLVVQARRGAQVTVPFDGRILYSGLFRNLGRLLILNVGNGYHIIIAGLERSFVVSDQLVLAGEPVGELADRSRPAPELYLEFQKDGRSIDPAPWLEKDGGHKKTGG